MEKTGSLGNPCKKATGLGHSKEMGNYRPRKGTVGGKKERLIVQEKMPRKEKGFPVGRNCWKGV